jgi:hypothetical protein
MTLATFFAIWAVIWAISSALVLWIERLDSDITLAKLILPFAAPEARWHRPQCALRRRRCDHVQACMHRLRGHRDEAARLGWALATAGQSKGKERANARADGGVTDT